MHYETKEVLRKAIKHKRSHVEDIERQIQLAREHLVVLEEERSIGVSGVKALEEDLGEPVASMNNVNLSGIVGHTGPVYAYAKPVDSSDGPIGVMCAPGPVGVDGLKGPIGYIGEYMKPVSGLSGPSGPSRES